MNLSMHSVVRIRQTMNQWGVAKDFADPLYHYLINGFNPGSFFTAVLANDFCGAIRKSHPANTLNALKDAVGWINEHMPKSAWGSYDRVAEWEALSEEDRRTVLEKEKMIFTEKEETWMSLKGAAISTYENTYD